LQLVVRGARPPCGLALERRSFLADGRVGEFTRSWYRGDIHEFVAELQSE
jgi:GntR family transcriptional regulator